MAVKANMMALTRIDEHIQSITAQSSHVVIYDLGADGWVKADCEGPLFLVKRKNKPYNKLVVTNRMSLTNFEEGVTTGEAICTILHTGQFICLDFAPFLSLSIFTVFLRRLPDATPTISNPPP